MENENNYPKSEDLVKYIISENKKIRNNMIEMKKIIKKMEIQHKNNKIKLFQICKHKWVQEPRVSCYDKVQYTCSICNCYKF